jgi:hypothetical protein
MPIVQNPAYQNPLSPLSAALGNLAKAMLSGPTTEEMDLRAAQAEQARAGASKATAEAELATRKLGAAKGIADTVAGMYGPLKEAPRPTPETVGPMPQMSRDQQIATMMPQLFENTAALGDIAKIGDIALAATANAPGATDPTVVRSLVGSGKTLGKDEAVSLPGQETIRQGNFAHAVNLENIEQGGANARNAADIAAANERARMTDDRSLVQVMTPNGPQWVLKRDAVGMPPVPPPAGADRYVVTPTPDGKGYTYEPARPGLAAPAPRGDQQRMIPANINTAIMENMNVVRKVDEALKELSAAPESTGTMKGLLNTTQIGTNLLDRWDRQGVKLRALIADVGSMKIHDRSGAAVTAAEFPRLKPFIPSVYDDDVTVRQKLTNFRNEYMNMLNEMDSVYSEAGGYRPNPALGMFLRGGSGPGAGIMTPTAPAAPQGGLPDPLGIR